MITHRQSSIAIVASLMLAPLAVGQATEYHVATTGNDLNPGSTSKPFKTIQAAANVAQPGDTITVHDGTYRERVDPPRGGKSDAERIVYQAAPGEKVVITGAEIVKNWTKVQGDVWKATIPNSYFGPFNPYGEVIHGDWSKNPDGYHVGTVYLNGDWLQETTKIDEVFTPGKTNALWFGAVLPKDAARLKDAPALMVDSKGGTSDCTILLAQFPGVNPNDANVEINVRETVFTPSKTGINYLTVRDFEMRAAAPPWAPPTARQIGILSAYWCKGWIIEGNTIRYSPCSGVALGKYGDEWDNAMAIQDKPEWLKEEMKGGSGGYISTIKRALTNGWNKATVGSHLVRGNTISHCEQSGIVGSLGCAFSVITGNLIHDIHVRGLYGGDEMAGIKFHGAIDVVISHNHIYNCGRMGGLWLDWMAQGTQVIGNLLHDNQPRDIFTEVDHGPFLVANNILLSPGGYLGVAQGGAFVHNLILGEMIIRRDGRKTPYHKAHSTEMVGLNDCPIGDVRWHNNLLGGKCNLKEYDSATLPVAAAGNVFTKGATPSKFDAEAMVKADFDPGIKLTQEADGWYLAITFDSAWTKDQRRKLVTSALLGKAVIPEVPFENPDGTPFRIDTDYLGKQRNVENPTPGPFETPGDGPLKLKIWEKPAPKVRNETSPKSK